MVAQCGFYFLDQYQSDICQCFPSLATMGDHVGAYPPVLVEGFDRITQCLSHGDKSNINIKCGIWRQGCDYLRIPIDFIAFFAIGVISPGEIHRHGAAANSKFAGVIID